MNSFFLPNEESAINDDVSILIQLQDMLMNITSESMSDAVTFILEYFSNSSGKCRQLSVQLLLPIKFHSKSFSAIIKLISCLLNQPNTNSNSSSSYFYLYELPRNLMKAITHEISSDNIIPYQNSIQAFLYHCYLANLFDINDVVSIFKECYDYFSLFNESVCSLFCWFAPELYEYNQTLFDEYFEAFQFHLKCTNFKSVYQNLLDNFDDLKNNGFALFKDKRATIESDDPVYSVLRDDQISMLQELFLAPNFDIDKHFDMSPFEPSWIMRFRPTGIQIAAFFGSLKCFKFYMLNNANVHVCTESMPLPYFAIAGGNAEIIHLTEQMGCDFSCDVLHSSVIFHQYQIFEWLTTIKMCDLREKDSNDDSVLHLAVLADNMKVLQYFYENEVTIEEKDEFSMSLIHYAARFGNFAVLSFLINRINNNDYGNNDVNQNEINYNNQNNNNNNINSNNINYYGDNNNNINDIVVNNNNTDDDNNCINNNDNEDYNSFNNNDMDIRKRKEKNNSHINKKNCNKVNERDNQQMTPLHYAVKYRQYEAVEVLLEIGSTNVNAKNSSGWSPLHFAVNTNNVEIVKLLLAHPKIDLHIRNNDRVTPMILANRLKFEDIQKLISISSCQTSAIRPQTTPMVCRRPLTGSLNGRRPCTVSTPQEKRRPQTSLNHSRQTNSFLPDERKNQTNCNATTTATSILSGVIQNRREKPKLRVPNAQIQQQQHAKQQSRMGRTPAAMMNQGCRKQCNSTLPTARIGIPGHVNFVD